LLLQFSDKRIERQEKGEKLSLLFKTCELDDTGTYSVEIMEFVKNGEKDQTDCWLQVEGRWKVGSDRVLAPGGR
jgi:hypothetical protein